MPRRAAIFGKLLRELRAHLAQVLQLEVVVLQQARVHSGHPRRRRDPRSRTLPVSRSISVRTSSSSGTGCAQSCAVNLDADDVVMIELARPRPALRTCSVAGRMRGSKSRIACRMARSRSATSSDEAVWPESAGRPKLITDRRTCGACARSTPASSRVALNSQARSRSTACRSRLFDITRCSRGSCFLSGSSSVSRSSSAGCSRSCGVSCSAMVAGGSAVARRLPSSDDRADVHQRHVAGVGREDPLAEPAVRVRRDLLPDRLARRARSGRRRRPPTRDSASE